MADREKVTKALENCVRNGVCINCEYEEHVACKICLMADALELLKEQQKQIQALKKNNNYLKNKVKDQRALIEAYKTGVRWEKRT